MFKSHWRAVHKTIYGHKKKVCLDKTFPLGHFMHHFIMCLHTSNDYKATNEIYNTQFLQFINESTIHRECYPNWQIYLREI